MVYRFAGETAEEFWDVESDKAIANAEPMAKKTKAEEWHRRHISLQTLSDGLIAYFFCMQP